MYHDLIAQFAALQRRPAEPTFLEIGGFPHYEQVISNFLAFFFNPQAEHGLNDLLLRAMQSALGIEHLDADVTVETEVEHIDIVVAGTSQAFAIENKIYHHAEANPFERYVQVMERRYPRQQRHFVLLALHAEAGASRRAELVRFGYRTITYAQLFAALRPLMGQYAERASPRYWHLLIDLTKTIDNLARGSRFDMDTIQFFAENEQQLADLQREITNLRAHLREKLNGLHQVMRSECADLLGSGVVSDGAYHRDGDALFRDTFYVDVSLPYGRVGVDTIVTLSGWELKLVPRGGCDVALLRQVIESRWACEFESDRFRLSGISMPDSLNADLGVVAQVTGTVIRALAQSASAGVPALV